MTVPAEVETGRSVGGRHISSWRRGIGRRRAALLALLAYAILSLVMTWPLASRLGSHLPGLDADTWTHAWTFWWIKQAIAEGLNPFYTDLLYYPQGVSLTTHNIAWFHIVLWLPLQALIGGVAAYGLIYLIVFTLNAFAMYLLAVEWTHSRLAAFIGGLIFGFWPYVVSNASSPNMTAVFWLPLALLFLKRTLQKGRILDAALSALFIAMIGITRWQLFIMAVPVLALFLLYQLVTDRTLVTRRTVGLLVLVGILTVVIMAPLATPVIAGRLASDDPGEPFATLRTTRTSDLAAYLVPNGNLAVYRQAVTQLPDHLQDTQPRVEFIGYASLILAIIGALTNWRSARLWLLMAVILVLLALGPKLSVAGQSFPQIPMPYRLFEDEFLVRVLRHPQRFNVFLGLPVGMLAAIGMTWLLGRQPSRQKATLLAALAGILILAEYALLPYQGMRPRVPEWYQALAAEPDRSGVLGLPLAGNADKWYMMYQMGHGKPLVAGHVSRPSSEAYSFLDSTPFLRMLREDNVMNSELYDVSRQLRVLADANVPYLVLHKRFAQSGQMSNWRQWLGIEPAYEDAEVVVYNTELLSGRDFDLKHNLTDEVGLVNAEFAPSDVAQGSTVIVETLWGSAGRPGGNYDACVRLIDSRGEIVQSDCRPPEANRATSNWEANELVRGAGRQLNIDPFFEPGAYTLAVALVDSESGQRAGREIPLGQLEVTALPRVFDPPAPERPVTARWSDRIALLGYDLTTSADSLQLKLYWKAFQRMDNSYKMFVHLIDASTETIVAQEDTVPRLWTYPTSWWEQGEVVADTITLPFSRPAGGRYRLQVGFYDPDSGERLPVSSVDGELFPDNVFPLTTFE